MRLVTDFIGNRLFIIVAVSWFIAQLLKTVLYFAVNKKFCAERLFGAGGMPSAHSASVTALVFGTSVLYGTGGFEFAVAAVLAAIVIYDARGVRKEAGEHAKILNRIVDLFNVDNSKRIDAEKRLNELIGHTGIQILMGILLGAAVCTAAYFSGFFNT